MWHACFWTVFSVFIHIATNYTNSRNEWFVNLIINFPLWTWALCTNRRFRVFHLRSCSSRKETQIILNEGLSICMNTLYCASFQKTAQWKSCRHSTCIFFAICFKKRKRCVMRKGPEDSLSRIGSVSMGGYLKRTTIKKTFK